MKKMVISLFLLWAVAVATPHLVSYQGKLTDTNGKPVSGQVAMVFSLYKTQTGGKPFWTETQQATVDTNGIFNVLLGSVTPLQSFPQACWLEFTINGHTSPRQQITSVTDGYIVTPVIPPVPVYDGGYYNFYHSHPSYIWFGGFRRFRPYGGWRYGHRRYGYR